jgi:hypothetical protein
MYSSRSSLSSSRVCRSLLILVSTAVALDFDVALVWAPGGFLAGHGHLALLPLAGHLALMLRIPCHLALLLRIPLPLMHQGIARRALVCVKLPPRALKVLKKDTVIIIDLMNGPYVAMTVLCMGRAVV